MTYLDYINLFNRYDRELRFSDGASRLYIKLLDVVNEINRSRPKGAAWVIDFQRSDGYVAGVCGWSVNTVKKHREELEKRRLVSGDFGQVGRNGTGKYHLCHPDENLSDVDTFSPENLSNVDTIPELNLSDVDIINPVNLSTSDTFSPENELNLSRNLSNVDTLYIEEENNNTSAAVAAGVGASFSGNVPAEQSATKPNSSKKPKKNGASLAEIAALDLPHTAPEFAEAWRTFYTDNTKQVGKPLTAFELMLKKLGKHPAAFAVVMLEAAIQGNWSGVENAGTARAFLEWQNEQTRQPTPRPMPAPLPSTGPAPRTTPDLNPEVVAERQAQREAEAAASRQRIRAASLAS